MKQLIEHLEGRTLFAGVTILTHGLNGNVTGWVEEAAKDIQDRAGGATRATIYTMTVKSSNVISLKVDSFGPDSGQLDYRNTTDAELIVKLDWSSVSNGFYSTSDVADKVSSYLRGTHDGVPPLVEMPIHLIGHSRGASLMSALSQNLGKAGIWVDQMTSLDPHPVDGKDDYLGLDLGDAAMASYDNVYFADNYWRTDGNSQNLDFDGESIPGAHEGNLNNIVQKAYVGSAHMAVTAYYDGTIDLNGSEGGDHPILPTWYGSSSSKPARDATGYEFSRIVGGARPADGISTALGGTGTRKTAGQSGTQWANGFALANLGESTLVSGQTLRTRLLLQDRDSALTTSIYLDANQNPYDGATHLGSKLFNATELINGKIDVSTASVSPGTYYILAKVSDESGTTRWTYSTTPVTIAVPDFAKITDRKLVINGTSGNNVITLAQNSKNYTTTLGGAALTFASSLVDVIEIYAGDGRDSIDASGTSHAVYVDAGPGMDTITGGLGDDTLSGGSQSDVINGNIGNDVLSGNGGNDLVLGAGGYDRLYANSGNDTLDGGSNVDRLFGSDDADYMIGGRGNDKIYGNAGNDTLIGGADSDLLNGGDGTDTADNDPTDLRTSIEILLT